MSSLNHKSAVMISLVEIAYINSIYKLFSFLAQLAMNSDASSLSFYLIRGELGDESLSYKQALREKITSLTKPPSAMISASVQQSCKYSSLGPNVT
jgi:hypothetical protein